MKKFSTKLSVDLGDDLVKQLDSYCISVNKSRSHVIRELVSKLPTGETSPVDNHYKSLLSDPSFNKRVLRLLLIVKSKFDDAELKKEAFDLWQSVRLYSK